MRYFPLWFLRLKQYCLTSKRSRLAGPYCGIYSLIACLDTFDKHPDIRTLLAPEYVGSYQGSSDRELVEATESQGLFAKTYRNLTWRELQETTSPMILHFRSSYSDSKYNHWVAYLGVDGKRARIIDIPHPLATISFAELMAKWDGTAILISDKPIQDRLIFSSNIRYIYLIGSLFGLVFCLQYFFWDKKKEVFAARTYLERLKRSVLQTGAFLVALCTLAILLHLLSPVGFLNNPTAVAEVTRRYYAANVPEITYDEMKEFSEQKNCIIFDARYYNSFKSGSIPGAKNMAVNSSLTERQQLLATIDKNQRIVVFCQSAGCGYANEIAHFLKFNGYSNIVIYRNGYWEWAMMNDEK